MHEDSLRTETGLGALCEHLGALDTTLAMRHATVERFDQPSDTTAPEEKFRAEAALAGTLAASGQTAQALTVHRRLLATQTDVLGPTDPMVLVTHTAIARLTSGSDQPGRRHRLLPGRHRAATGPRRQRHRRLTAECTTGC